MFHRRNFVVRTKINIFYYKVQSFLSHEQKNFVLLAKEKYLVTTTKLLGHHDKVKIVTLFDELKKLHIAKQPKKTR